MAETDLQYIKDSVERDHESHGWSEGDFSARLDNGENRNRIVAAYWRGRATEVITLVNTSESGSSRGNDAIYSRMSALADRYAALADYEEYESGGTSEATLGSFDMERS